jgi:hypothetical protein
MTTSPVVHVRWTIAVVALAAVSVGCGGGPDGAPAPRTSTTPAPARTVLLPPTSPRAESAVPPVAMPESPPASDVASLVRSFYFILDGSGSMDENPGARCGNGAASTFPTKIAAARWAIGEFLRQVPAEDRIGLYVFDRDGQREVVPLGTGNRDQFLTAVKEIHAAGGTPLAEAIITGVDRLAAQREKQLGYGDFRLVVVTDGEANGRRLEDGTAYALANRIPIYTIGFCVGRTHTLFKHSVSYRAANSPAELRRGLEDTLGELESFDMKAFGGQ